MDEMLTHEPPASKSELRLAVKAALSDLSERTRAAETLALNERLEQDALAAGFAIVLATVPLADEPDLTPFLARWLALGRRVALARTGPQRSLSFHFVDNLNGPWEPHPLGLREPKADAPIWVPGPSTLCLVPGLAFAPAPAGGWWRLGRGGGYYDRWLAVHGHSVTTWGIGFSAQCLKWVPTDAYDCKIESVPGYIH